MEEASLTWLQHLTLSVEQSPALISSLAARDAEKKAVAVRAIVENCIDGVVES